MKTPFRVLPLLLLVPCALSQQSLPSMPPLKETVVVLGNSQPTTLGESPRSVVVLDTEEHPLAFATAEDYLRTDASTFITQRGAGGAQADISIRGSSFEQTLVLLNGLRINTAQTAHHNLDLPVPLEAMQGIEVLHGGGSTLYGSDALGGVVNFLTAAPTATSLLLRAGAGSFGENEQSLLGSIAHKRWSEMIAGTRNFSTGFITDRDYRIESTSSEMSRQSSLGTTDVLLATSDRSFGADQFYGPYNSWERTKGWFASVRQDFGEKTEAAFGYRRHADNFVLLRNDPSFYANQHIDQSWQGVVRRKDEFSKRVTLFYGLEADGDRIGSNNLGRHARNRGAGYLDLDIHPAKRWNLSAGMREEILSGGARSVWSPALAGTHWLKQTVRVRASGGSGFRLPTYTDLYYSDPTTIGDPSLRPESAWSGDAGADWYTKPSLAISLTLFYSRQHNAIDYVRTNASQPWQATNLNGLRFTGLENSLNWRPSKSQNVKIAWTGISGAQKSLNGLESKYVFNYPVSNISFEWMDNLRGAYLLRTRVQSAQRYHRDSYAVWDVEVAREHGWVRPYLRTANLSNTGYQDIEGVPMPGRSLVGGIAFNWRRPPESRSK